MKTVLRSASVLALLGAALAARAMDAYSDLGAAPNLYNGGSRYGPLESVPLAFRFVATATGTLTSFMAPLKEPNTTAVAFAVAFYADAAGQTIGDQIASGAGTTSYSYTDGSNSELVTVPIAAGPTLVSGTAYWAEVAFASNGYWALNDTGATGRLHYGPGYSTSDLAAFSVQVNPTPEPSALAAMGLVAVAVLRRRKRA